MSCSIAISDGVANVVLDLSARELAVAFTPLEGGDAILRFLDGSAAKQTRWSAQRLTVSGAQAAPSGLLELDYSKPLSVTVARAADTLHFACYSLGVSETWTYTQGQASWSLTLEEL